MGGRALEGKVCIVTGGARGIGLAIAKRIAGAGAYVAIADLDFESARTASDGLKASGSLAGAFSCDVSSSQSVHLLINDVLDAVKRIDILVNNAGIVGHVAPIQDQSDADWQSMMATDLSGVFFCCREVIPRMLKQGGGRIINVASIAGKEGNPGMVPYCSAKAGLIGLTKALAKEVAGSNIFVNVITPSLVETAMVGELSAGQIQYVMERVPMGRLCKPEEVAALALWLATEEASFSTGAVFDISGGRATY